MKALKWRPRTSTSDEPETPSPEQEVTTTTGSEVTDTLLPPEVSIAGDNAQVLQGSGTKTGNETPTEVTSGHQLPEMIDSSETPETKSPSTRRRKFGVFSRPPIAKSFDAEAADGKRDSKKRKRKLWSHVRALSVGQSHSIVRPDATGATLHKTPTLSAPHLITHHDNEEISTATPSRTLLASESGSIGVSVTEINVIDVDGDVEVFNDEVSRTSRRLL